MPPSSILKSAARACQHSHRKANIVPRPQRDCQATFDAD